MSHLLQVLLLLAFIIAAAKLAGALATRIGQPAVFGEILVGLLLGPTMLDLLAWPIFSTADGTHGNLLPLVRDLSEIGVILLMFVAGLETDLVEMRRVGSVALAAATGGVVLPLVCGAATAWAFGLPLYWEGIFIGTILTATSVSISAQTLIELGALKSREGSTILGAAVIDDVMGIVVLSVVVALVRSTGAVDVAAMAWVVGRMIVFFVIAWALAGWLPRLSRWAASLGVSQGLLASVVVMALLYAWAAEYIGGVAAITGSYLAGVIYGQGPLKHQVDAGVHPLTYSLLVPVFFIGIGLQANARELGQHVWFTVAIVVVAIVTKAIGCGVASRLCGFSTRESVRVGVGMISRGEVGLIIAGYGLANGIISRDVFSASVLMVLVTTMVTPPLLRLTFGRASGPTVTVEETIGGPPEEAQARRS